MSDPNSAMLRPASQKPPSTGKFKVKSNGFVMKVYDDYDGEVTLVEGKYVVRTHIKCDDILKAKIARCFGLIGIEFEVEYD